MEEDHTWDNQMTVSKGNPLDRNIGAKQSEADFNMGWVDMGLKGVSNKIRPIINGNKGNQKLKPKSGSVLLRVRLFWVKMISGNHFHPFPHVWLSRKISFSGK